MEAEKLARQYFELDAKVEGASIGRAYIAREKSTGAKRFVRILGNEDFAGGVSREPILSDLIRTSKLRHPNIATIYDVFDDGRDAVIVQEYVEGKNLANVVGKPLEPVILRAIFTPVLEAITAIHRIGIAHGDLKPSNILLSGGNRPVLLDFGLGRLTAHKSLANLKALAPVIQSENSTVLMALGFLGQLFAESVSFALGGSGIGGVDWKFLRRTLPFLAPEQIRTGELDPQSDLYSFGALLYKAATGKSPYQSLLVTKTYGDILQGNLARAGTLNDAIPHALRAIIDVYLSKEPSQRSIPPWEPAKLTNYPAFRVDQPQFAFDLGGGNPVMDVGPWKDLLPRSQKRAVPRKIQEAVSLGKERAVKPKSSASGSSGSLMDTPPGRAVNTWFESDDDIPPLHAKQSYIFKLNIGRTKKTTVGASTPFSEPTFAKKDTAELLISISSHDFDIATSQQILELPREGDSPTVETVVVPRHAGSATIEIIIFLRQNLAVQQILEVETEIVEPVEAIAK